MAVAAERERWADAEPSRIFSELIMAYKLGFGKHAERTIEWLFFNDPGYVWWMIANNADKNLHGAARQRFDDLVRRARHLRVPGKCWQCRSRPIARMFLTRHISGGLGRVDFFCDTCKYEGGSPSYSTTPAFYTPDFFRDYDKTGGRFLVDEIKCAYFGNSKHRMTQSRMEEFFDTPGNFINF